MVFLGFVTAWRFARRPTSRSPVFDVATTEGVVRAPSAFSIISGSPPFTMAIAELVVPRSIPSILLIVIIVICFTVYFVNLTRIFNFQSNMERFAKLKIVNLLLDDDVRGAQYPVARLVPVAQHPHYFVRLAGSIIRLLRHFMQMRII